ncbi:ribonuclease HII [Neobacillus sp. OS1-32]|jgi:ribonuclease HII|uniref:Ribonuclease HII n=1 Tax=Neobacillus paridis TaxID=2803862 RepID=A0ABS1TPK0_9BACI|nr:MULTISPECIES: ribonuclease HII [Neobacillus]MBL4952664.1 ribonuclease HII [Neobacillus paridis]WML31830.1 ribonuclease HII [Neobacillus sp. OS1-32]
MKRPSIAEIEKNLTAITDELHPYILELEKDSRIGVQKSLNKWRKLREEEQFLKAKFHEMTQYERKFWFQGYQLIAGVDEVGRGPLAGPVMAAAVILPDNFYLPGIDDSKKLSEKKREEYAEIIKREAVSVSIAQIQADEIDEINIYEATKKAMKSAIASLHIQPDFLLIDAMPLMTPYPSESIIKGDAQSISIAAASIVAKTTRDKLMKEISLSYPEYGFEHNMGYGTKEHLQAIKKYGITPYHRKSFSPIKEIYMPNLFS